MVNNCDVPPNMLMLSQLNSSPGGEMLVTQPVRNHCVLGFPYDFCAPEPTHDA